MKRNMQRAERENQYAELISGRFLPKPRNSRCDFGCRGLAGFGEIEKLAPVLAPKNYR
jgi:hypothetical protein